MAHVLDPEKLKEVLRPMSVKARGLYISKAIQEILQGSKDYTWVKNSASKGKKKAPKEYSDAFERFWKAYHPMRKAAKRKCWETFYNASENQELLADQCEATLKWQRETAQWKDNDGQYFRQAATWLNQFGYEDENPNAGREMETYINDDGEMKTRPRPC